MVVPKNLGIFWHDNLIQLTTFCLLDPSDVAFKSMLIGGIKFGEERKHKFQS